MIYIKWLTQENNNLKQELELRRKTDIQVIIKAYYNYDYNWLQNDFIRYLNDNIPTNDLIKEKQYEFAAKMNLNIDHFISPEFHNVNMSHYIVTLFEKITLHEISEFYKFIY